VPAQCGVQGSEPPAAVPAAARRHARPCCSAGGGADGELQLAARGRRLLRLHDADARALPHSMQESRIQHAVATRIYHMSVRRSSSEYLEEIGNGDSSGALGGSRRAFVPACGKPGGCLYTQHEGAGNATRRAFVRRLPRFVDREQY
jgi:hypothetical protein